MTSLPYPALGVQSAEAVATPTERWAVIWEGGLEIQAPDRLPDDRALAELTLCLEFTLPPMPGEGPVRLWQGAAETGRAVALYLHRDGAFRLVHGGVDVTTAPDFGRVGETLSLRYRTCSRGRGDVVDIWNHDRGQRHRTRAGLALAGRLDEMLPRDDRFLRVCHVAAIAEFGLAPTDLPGLSGDAMVMTTEGPRPVSSLRPGQVVVTATGSRRPLRWIERRSRLCLGRHAPVLLRAPYFGLSQDIWVTPETCVVRSGAVVEYLFGEEQVLMRAGDLLASPGAQRDRRQPVRSMHHLMFDDHACVLIGRCGIETALLSDVVAAGDARTQCRLSESDRTPCLLVLDRTGAQALVAASGKGRRYLG